MNTITETQSNANRPEIGDFSFLEVMNASGLPQKISKATLIQLLEKAESEIFDNAFIAYHRNSDNFPLAARYEDWASLQNSGEVADGVMIVEGGHGLIIAPTELASANWSSTATGTGTYTSYNAENRKKAFTLFDGQERTAAIMANSTLSKDGATFAPGFCAAYSRTHVSGDKTIGKPAGQYWLPSVGEMLMIWANFKKINYGLSLINGATQLAKAGYWTSTEFSATTAWYLSLSYGYLSSHGKVSYSNPVRPVSAFIA